MVWYSTWGLFGKSWEELTGVTSKKLKKAHGNKPVFVLLGTNFAAAVVLAVAIDIVSAYAKSTSIWLALATGLVLALGLSVTTLLQHNVFELKSLKLTMINSGYQLVFYLAIALTIGLGRIL